MKKTKTKTQKHKNTKNKKKENIKPFFVCDFGEEEPLAVVGAAGGTGGAGGLEALGERRVVPEAVP